MAKDVTQADFQPHLNKGFTVKDHSLSLTLSAVDAPTLSAEATKQLQSAKAGEKGEVKVRSQPFGLTFSARSGKVLKEGVYTVQGPGGANFDIYLVPSVRGGEGPHHYHATFC